MDRVNDYGSGPYHNMLSGIQMKLVTAGSSMAHATTQAQTMIYNTVQRQAAMMAFLDNFKMLGVVFFAVIPVLVLMKNDTVCRPADVPVH